MFASRHVVFVGPGALFHAAPEGPGVRRLEAKDLHTPRAEFACDSAADAERLATALHDGQRATLVAGPEQPPVEANWRVVVGLEALGSRWLATDANGQRFELELASARAVSLVDWRDAEHKLDRAALLHLDAHDRPIFVRATALGADGNKVLAELLDAFAGFLPPAGRVRSRTLGPEPLRRAGLSGDLLPLMLLVVDALDTAPGLISRPLDTLRHTSEEIAAPRGTQRSLAAFVTWAWWVLSMASMPLVLVLLAAGWFMDSYLDGALTGLLAVAIGAWASQRLYWARWLERTTFGARQVLPQWPLRPEVPGRPPAPPGLALEVLVLALALLLRTGPHPTAVIATALTWAAPALVALGALGLWERAVAPHSLPE